VAVVHGGPGAPGDMAPVAGELASERGVLEPLQTRDTLDGQIEELKTVLEQHADRPVTLVGHSWGAMLGYMLAARHPDAIDKLVLVCSGVYDEESAARIEPERLSRLSEADRKEVLSLIETLQGEDVPAKAAALARYGELISRADSYDNVTHPDEIVVFQPDINRKVWSEAHELRKRGELLEMGRSVACPVIAIHGDYDPHPAEGVRILSTVIKDFRFILLEKCGHYPWYERQARDSFYRILKGII